LGLDNKNIHGADDLLRRIAEAKEYLRTDAKEVVGTEAVKHFKNNFVEEGFDGQKWAARSGAVRLQKNILTGQGSGDHLGDSIDFRIEGEIIIIYTDKIYAEIHNEGGEITVTPKMKRFFWAKHHEYKEAGDTDIANQWKYMALSSVIKIKQRKFIGQSNLLNDKIVAKLTTDLKRIFNS
jgi:phage gpG-like protein